MMAVLLGAPACRAGGGPENVFLVINQRSWASVTIGNHYQHLRAIPPSNVLKLDWAGSITETDVESFRAKILGPVIAAIERRKLTGLIDYVVYSSDFPYAVDISADLKTTKKFAKGSLTGLTYLAPLVLAKSAAYSGQNANWYMRHVSAAGRQLQPTRGFRFSTYWNPQGDVVASDGMRFILSTMLGYTSGRGNSLAEVLDYLQRSANADETSPRGTVYYARNKDIRSESREYRWDLAAAARGEKKRQGESVYKIAVKELTRIGVRARIVDGVYPTGQTDVAGAMLGSARFNWSRSNNEIIAGAICENFTSFGGVLAEDAKQTPLTQLLRFGAAGSSGTVVEPYAIWQKFPHPFVHVHYARGCSLAEAFYQSVSQPYQLLVVGDPLCQPWARRPKVIVAGIKDGQTVTGKIRLSARVTGEPNAKYCEAFVDGSRLARTPPNVYYELDSATLPDGYHELRVVAVADNLIETQGGQIVGFATKNHGRTLSILTRPPSTVRWDRPLQVEAESPGAQGIALYANREILARAAGEKVRLEIQPSRLGLGPTRLTVVGLHGTNRTDNVFSPPIDVEVLAPKLMPALPRRTGVDKQTGVRVSSPGGTAATVSSLSDEKWLGQIARSVDVSAFAIDGLVNVPSDGVFQLQTATNGDAEIAVDNQRVLTVPEQTFARHYVMLPLRQGWHHIRADVKRHRGPRFELMFGDRGCRSLGAPEFYAPPR